MKIKLYDKSKIIDYFMNIVVIVIMLYIMMYVKECPCAFQTIECCECPHIKFNLNNLSSITTFNSSDILNISFSDHAASQNIP